MAGDELFKRYLEIGASVLGMSRERAESIVKDLVASGEVARSQATKAADWLVERGRTGTEELAELVRREIRQQVAALGLVTKEDLARLEARLQEAQAQAQAEAPAPAPAKSRTRKAAPAATKTAGTGGGKASGSTRSAGISRSASVRKRSGAPGSSQPDAAPPDGGGARPKA